MTLDVARFETPLGPMIAAVRAGRLCTLGFADGGSRQERALTERLDAADVRSAADPAGVVSHLRRYFAGELEALAGVEVDPPGTDFQQRVWKRLRRIPAGRTMSYGELARAIGHPDAMRAVGAANGANPICLVIPCHRVIGADGRLTGYAYGVERKRWLLDHEARAARLL